MDGQPADDGATWLAAARRLEPLVRSVSDRFDRERTLPEELVDAIGQAGLFGLWLPRALGGPELPVLPFLEVMEELARQDGSAGWCAAIPAGYARLAGALDPEVAATVFRTGRGILTGTLNPTGTARAVPGGYRVTGRWGYGSFTFWADWVLGNCITHDDSGPRQDSDGGPAFRLCLFPRRDVELFDNWHVGGLRGTGSIDYQVTDVFVPEAFSIPLDGFNPAPRQPGILYQVPMLSTFSPCLAMVTLGIARAAIESLIEIAAGKTPMGSRTVLREKVVAQVDLARAEGLVRSGRAWLFDELGGLWHGYLAGRPATLRQRALVRLAAVQATQFAIQAVDLMYAAAGGAALFEGGRLERCFRDAHAAGQHVALSPYGGWEPMGRILFGLEPGIARF